MTKITQQTLIQLEADNQDYCDWNQAPRADCVLMAQNGHPAGAAYLELRAFYDTLKYACNAGARHFSYKNKLECSHYWAPTLDLGWYPEGELRHFGHIYPAHARWSEYILAVAEAGWPAGAQARLEGGSWIIRTQSLPLREKFLELQTKLDTKGRFTIKTEIDVETKQAFYSIDISLYDIDRAPALQKKIVSLLKKYQKNYVLPERSVAQNAADQAPLPLSAKKFALGNVAEVTVTERHVMVPLIALPADESLILKHCQDLEDLCTKGFPFVQVKDWLSRVLTPTSLSTLEQKFA